MSISMHKTFSLCRVRTDSKSLCSILKLYYMLILCYMWTTMCESLSHPWHCCK